MVGGGVEASAHNEYGVFVSVVKESTNAEFINPAAAWLRKIWTVERKTGKKTIFLFSTQFDKVCQISHVLWRFLRMCLR